MMYSRPPHSTIPFVNCDLSIAGQTRTDRSLPLFPTRAFVKRQYSLENEVDFWTSTLALALLPVANFSFS